MRSWKKDLGRTFGKCKKEGVNVGEEPSNYSGGIKTGRGPQGKKQYGSLA